MWVQTSWNLWLVPRTFQLFSVKNHLSSLLILKLMLPFISTNFNNYLFCMKIYLYVHHTKFEKWGNRKKSHHPIIPNQSLLTFRYISFLTDFTVQFRTFCISFYLLSLGPSCNYNCTLPSSWVQQNFEIVGSIGYYCCYYFFYCYCY